MSDNQHSRIENANRIVIKVGTSTLTHMTGMINIRKIEKLVKVISDIANSGKEIVLVSSGAVSAGFAKLGRDGKGSTLEEKQAAAAVGQCELMNMYDRLFSEYGYTVAQILITKDVIDLPFRRDNAINTFSTLIENRCIPIVNENDSVSFEGLKFGGNDTLSAYVALLTNADLLINMSDIDGLYDSDPRKNPSAKLIPTVTEISDDIRLAAGGAGERGTGGMLAKLEAAELVGTKHIQMIILNGANPEILYSVFEDKFLGTVFEL